MKIDPNDRRDDLSCEITVRKCGGLSVALLPLDFNRKLRRARGL